MAERLVDRRPAASAADLAGRFVPPRRFSGVRFSTFVPDPAHPSQAEAKAALERFATEIAAPKARKKDQAKPGRYLDGGFGVGKTHLLASLWHAAPAPKAYVTFEELTAFIGFVGMQPAVHTFARHHLLCIDEFELDDVANTRMAVTFLRSVIQGGTKLAATSNAIPDRLGEGRFNAEDFQREILAIAAHWDVLRLDGPDYRSTPEHNLQPRPPTGNTTTTVDDFDELLAHLRHVHPVQYGPLLDGVDTVVVENLHPIENQGSALLFVQLVDEIYDAGVTFVANGCAVTDVFPESYRHGGYRKKYGRCESRLGAMLSEAAAS